MTDLNILIGEIKVVCSLIHYNVGAFCANMAANGPLSSVTVGTSRTITANIITLVGIIIKYEK